MPSCGVSVSITFVNSVKTNKHIFKKFSPSSYSSFSVPNSMAIFQLEPP